MTVLKVRAIKAQCCGVAPSHGRLKRAHKIRHIRALNTDEEELWDEQAARGCACSRAGSLGDVGIACRAWSCMLAIPVRAIVWTAISVLRAAVHHTVGAEGSVDGRARLLYFRIAIVTWSKQAPSGGLGWHFRKKRQTITLVWSVLPIIASTAAERSFVLGTTGCIGAAVGAVECVRDVDGKDAQRVECRCPVCPCIHTVAEAQRCCGCWLRLAHLQGNIESLSQDLLH